MAKRVLVACEFSGTVREAFRKRGFDAWSCDVLPAEDNSPYHFQHDVLSVINGKGGVPLIDLMIAHPPCTYLCNSGVCWLHPNTGQRTKKNYTTLACRTRWKQLILAVNFFRSLQGADIPHIAIENPIPHRYARDGFLYDDILNAGNNFQLGIGKYTQIIQPHWFGHPESKATCLWLYNLPKLAATHHVGLPTDKTKRMRLHYLPPGPDRWKIRSRTFQGIADAMAKQWGDYIERY